jgi:hypothetical protein
MSSYQQSIGRPRAIALYSSGWWIGRTAREIAKFQLFTRELCLPFDLFRAALEETLGRPVWTHELGFDTDGIIHEFLGERDAPTLEEILGLIPDEKRQLLCDAGISG